MSRIGKIAVPVPTEVKYKEEKGEVHLEGPKGKLSLCLPAGIKVEQKEQELFVSRKSDVKQYRANHGTVRSLLTNMVAGVKDGHKKELEIQGVGFRAQLQGDKLSINLGFSHPVEYIVPKEVKVTVPKPTEIIVEGTDKAAVGHIAAVIRGLKPPEPYKGKGIRYVGENVRRKQGKSITK